MSSTNLDNLDVTVPEQTTNTVVPVLEPKQELQVPQPYAVSQADIDFLRKQISITDEHATQLLLKNNGNYVNAIIDFYQVTLKKEESVGIAQPSITVLSLDNEQSHDGTITGHKMSYDVLSASTVNTLYKTYLFVATSPGYEGFTKKKKFCTLKELIDTEYIPNITSALMQSPRSITVYELVGRSNEILEKWSMPSSAIVLCPEQIVPNQHIVDKQLFDKLNKVATQIARHSGIILESESVLHMAYVIGNVAFI